MRKLQAFVEEIKSWLCDTKRLLYIHFESRKIVLEALLTNPFLSLFSNVLPNHQALKVLDRFVYFGQNALLDIIKHVFKTQQDKLFQIGDQFELQKYLSRQIYLDAIEEDGFFPEILPE